MCHRDVKDKSRSSNEAPEGGSCRSAPPGHGSTRCAGGRGGQDLAGALERPWQVTAGMHAPASEAGAGTPGRWYPWSRVGP